VNEYDFQGRVYQIAKTKRLICLITVAILFLANLAIVFGDSVLAFDREKNPSSGFSEFEENPLSYLALGDQHRESKEFLEAISAYQLALIEDPQNQMARFGLAMVQYEVGETQEAIQTYKKLLEINPGLWQAEMNLGIIWLNQRNLAQALNHFKNALDLSPQNSRLLFLTGQVYLLQKDLDSAESSLVKALAYSEQGTEKIEIRSMLISIYMKKKNFVKAAQHLVESRLSAKDKRKVDKQLAGIFLDLNQKKEALTYLENLANEPSAGPDVHEVIGRIKVEEKDYLGGIESLEIALKKQSDPVRRDDLYLELANLHFQLNQVSEAIDILEKAAKTSPNWEIHYTLGSLYIHDRRWNYAKRSLGDSLKLNSECVECYAKLGAIYMEQGDFGRVIPLLSRYKELKPENVMTYFHLGIAYDKLRKYEEAVQIYEQFLEIDKGRHDRETFQVSQRLQLLKKRVGKK